jgi:hypothetical protein
MPEKFNNKEKSKKVELKIIEPLVSNSPGYHKWEIWKREITKEDLEKLLPEIEKEAQELLRNN